jgi:hypothetical protein
MTAVLHREEGVLGAAATYTDGSRLRLCAAGLEDALDRSLPHCFELSLWTKPGPGRIPVDFQLDGVLYARTPAGGIEEILIVSSEYMLECSRFAKILEKADGWATLWLRMRPASGISHRSGSRMGGTHHMNNQMAELRNPQLTFTKAFMNAVNKKEFIQSKLHFTESVLGDLPFTLFDTEQIDDKDLDMSVETDFPVKIYDREPFTRGAYDVLNDVDYTGRANCRYKMVFKRFTTPTKVRAITELRAGAVDMRKKLTDTGAQLIMLLSNAIRRREHVLTHLRWKSWHMGIYRPPQVFIEEDGKTLSWFGWMELGIVVRYISKIKELPVDEVQEGTNEAGRAAEAH